ncbi:urease accessory protein UreE [Psychrobacter sp. BI730]|uniref:urease accessory protein UreE n=1 Tax=Psychrobacter sp. BI730 TaxID=2705463 RepID=UPI0015CE93C4|nr:urease accessory protein UreE [Psychrobacter sp. BI730]NYR10442.1 urease accessory protein UreE [Psychrobacter sp. BI730]
MKIFNTRLSTLSDTQKAQLVEQYQADDYLLLDFDTRQHSRFRAITVSGEAVGVDLPRTGVLKGNDVLINAAGELMQVIAKPQAVTKVTADDDFLLMKGAYHLGNRHVPLMFDHSFDQGNAGYALYFENDHVLAQMLENLGLHIESTSVPFEPETGAYQTGQGHSHGHAHSHAHSHSDSHSHKKSHSHDESHSHGHHHSHSHSHHDAPVGRSNDG